MKTKELRQWKKVFKSDLSYIAYELKDIIDAPCVIILNGEMGVGKTTFTKEFVSLTDKRSQTLSPSYSVLSETPNILHADFYRLEEVEEILHLELSLYLEDKQYFVVEWGEKYLSTLYKECPEDFNYYKLSIEVNPADLGHNSDKSDPDLAQSRNFFLEELTEIE